MATDASTNGQRPQFAQLADQIAESVIAVQTKLHQVSGPNDRSLDISWQIVFQALAQEGSTARAANKE